MNNKLKFLSLGFAAALFTGVLVNASPIQVNAEYDFIADLHNKTFLKVESGHNFTVVLSSENEVFTFGINDRGQLGNGTTTESLSVFNITSSFGLTGGETIIDIDTGWGFTVALTSSNRIFAWGDPQVVQLAKGLNNNDPQTTPFDLTSAFNPSNAVVRKLAAGDSNIMVWSDTNVVRMAGANDLGQLAQASTTLTLGAVSVNWNNQLNGEVLKDVGIFAQTAYALTESGKVLTWGNNNAKQVGNNGGAIANLPQNITASFALTGGEKVVSVSVGVNHGVAVTSAYKVFFWGTNANYAVGNSATLPLNTVKNTPFNATAAFKYQKDGYTTGLGIHTNDGGYVYYVQPLEVYTANDATFFLVQEGESYDGGPVDYYDSLYFLVIGLSTYDNQNYVIGESSNLTYIDELEYASWNTHYEGYNLIDIGFSRTNIIFLNTDGDFTIFGSNLYGQHGVGYVEDNGTGYNTNYSENVRYFIDDIYNQLPTNLTAPIDDYFYPVGGMTDILRDQYEAVFGYWYGFNDNARSAGILDYFFPEDYQTGYEFTDKEWGVITSQQQDFMRQIIATLFEDEILYDSWIRNDELIVEELDNNGREAASWIRYDMELYANYGSYNLAWNDVVTLDDETIAFLPTVVETRLDRYRELLSAVEAFEDTYLQPFLAEMVTLNNTAAGDISFTYFDEYYDEDALDLGFEQMEYLLANDFEEDILAIIEAYEALPELVQLLINEWNYEGIYEQLYYAYYYYFTDAYSNELNAFMSDVQEEDWYWYWPLFANLTDLEALLEKIEDLPEVSRQWFTATWEDQFEEVYYDYGSYEYWIFLNDILPHLQEGKPVYDQVILIEDFILDDEEFGNYVEVENAATIIEMYNDFLALSEEAQDLLDVEYITWIYSLALEALVNEVENQLWNLWDVEDENGVYGLFSNLDDVLSALAAFEALPEDALEYMDEDTIGYYEYLLSIQLPLEEGLEVYEQIMAIEALDLEVLDEDTIATISAMYEDYLNLSEDAQTLLDPDYVSFLVSLAVSGVEANVDNLPGTVEDFETLFNDAETKDDAVNNLLTAWSQYQAMSNSLKDQMDPEARAQLEAIYARYLELIKPSVDLLMIGLILVHLSAGVYFAFKKKDVLLPEVNA